MSGKHLTIYDIAREAGVSASTVSRALTNQPNVNKATRERIMAIAERHRFKPSLIARGLEQGQSKMFGIVLPSLTHPYYAELYSGAYEESVRNGYALLAQQLGQSSIGQEAINQLIELRLCGVLFVGGVAETTHAALREELSQLQRYMPIVAISAPMPGLDCIYMHNNLKGAVRQAVQHLLMLGHRRIAFIGGAGQIRNSGARGLGFLEGIAAISSEQYGYDHHESGYTTEAGELAVLNLLTGHGRERWPSALVAINDLVALGAMRQLRRMNLRIPEDMAIIGCDNQFFSAYTDPPLTTIDLQAADHAKSAVRMLLSACKTPVTPFTQLRDATLIVRESCGVRLGARHLG